MEMKWPPSVLDGLFCDRLDHNGIYYWFDAVKEILKMRRLKPKETMMMTFDV